MGQMHAADPGKSERLKRILRFLRERAELGATSMEVTDQCSVVAPATYVSEIRRAGFQIECTYEGRSQAGAKVYRYRLVDAALVQGDLFGGRS